MNKKQIFITKDLAKHLNKLDNKIIKEHNLKAGCVLPNKSVDFFLKQIKPNHSIYLYDLGFKNTKKVVPIYNHINKTGINPLREEPAPNIDFYDITEIYKVGKNTKDKAKIAVCFGCHQIQGQTTTSGYVQTRFLCNHAISAYYHTGKNIFAFVIE